MGWRNRPTNIDYISNTTKTIVFIDESGTSSLKTVTRQNKCNSSTESNDRYFTVTACIISRKDFESLRDSVMDLKNKYWNEAFFEYKGNTKRICFHSREIRGRKGPFSNDIINYDSFIADLSNLIENAPFTIISSNIDKSKHVSRYKYPVSPYNLCMNFVLERITKMTTGDYNCEIILESRGKKEDRELHKHMKNLLKNGTPYSNSDNFKRFSGVYFNPKWSKMHNDKKSYWGLELADICAYPIHKYLLNGTKDKAFKCLEKKLHNFPNYVGYGLKKFP